MSNQFYSYLSKKLVSFFKNQGLRGGERFYLQFDDKAQVKKIYEVLKSESKIKEFNYKHEKGSQYTTYAIRLEGVSIVVAATIDDITVDYLVTLRNKVSEQNGIWSNTSILFICNESRDSIRGGSSDLQKEGMPLHIKSITKNLRNEIRDSSLSKSEKVVVNFYLDQLLKDLVFQPSIWDLKHVLSLINLGTIDKEEYPKLGLFYDNNLKNYNYNETKMRKRLQENHEVFDTIRYHHEYSDVEKELEKMFDEKGVNKLKKEDWEITAFPTIKQSKDNFKQKDKRLKYIESNKKVTEEKKLYYWEKPLRDTIPGKRKRNIIVFNPNKKKNIKLSFQFEDYLKNEYIKRSRDICKTSGKKLKINLKHKKGQSSFYKATYEHNDQTKSKYEFHIAIVECDTEILESIKTKYKINNKLDRIVIINDGETIEIGNPEEEACELVVEEQEENFKLDANDNIFISSSSPAWSEGDLKFQIDYSGTKIPFIVEGKKSKATPIFGVKVWKLRRENQNSFIYEDNKLQQGTREHYPHEKLKEYLEIEKEWINNNCKFGKYNKNGSIDKLNIQINKELEEAYNELINYYQEDNLLPSLTYFDEKLKNLAKKYLKIFNQCIEEIEEKSILKKKQKNIFKLGMIKGNERIYLTPLHPLNIAYHLSVSNQLGKEKIKKHILKRLTPNNLLPYIFGSEDKLYRSVPEDQIYNWIVYEPAKRASIGDSSEIMANVIEEKIEQFVEHFNYLFISESDSPLKINLINIRNDKEVLKGVFNFIKSQIQQKGLNNVIPLEVALYNNVEEVSAFEKFSMYEDIEKIENEFDISLDSEKIDSIDMLRRIRENIHYYKLKISKEFKYAHISFYKMVTEDQNAKDNVDDIETGISLNGLLSSVTSISDREDYRTGFGTKNILNSNHFLIKVARNLNELAANLDNDGSNTYSKNQSIVTRISDLKEETLNKIYKSSYWVTFIEPNVDLDFFLEKPDDLLIIHYSEQYSSSEQYDAVTVTDKVNQYQNVIRQNLEDRDIVTDEKINSAIRAFNTINGEWLLRIISNSDHYSREKLSIMSAVKYALSLFDHPNILWIPISLEEILRIAGAVNLTKSKGIFSAKNLDAKGKHSDDLLLMGLEVTDKDIYIHFYPIEVKIGVNNSGVIKKAKEQINKTYTLIKKQLRKKDDKGNVLFKNKFFRNFFIRLFLANAQKFTINELWPEKNYKKINDVKTNLLNDDYIIGTHLEKHIGKGAVLSFKKDAHWRSIKKEENIILLELPEENGYRGVIRDIEGLKEKIHNGKTDIDTKLLLTNNYEKKNNTNEKEKVNETNDNRERMEKEKKAEDKKDEIKKKISKSKNPIKLENIRILLGNIEGSKSKIYWEFGNKDLGNRHLLISGKSGQGKTYFIECMLMELASYQISSIIFDYTGGFKSSKLEKEFKQYMDEKLEQFVVARDDFPISPFKRNKKELDEGVYIKEDNVDVAERIKNVFAAIYPTLGIQQKNAIYRAIISGLEEYGEEMNMKILRKKLENDDSNYAKTALSQLSLLIDKNPFDETEDYDWSDLEKDKGKVFIIQLSGFSRDIQLLITEFILWDLWYYKQENGDQNTPLPVVLDEAQNLDHSEKSPSARILSEGRKFGWSGWYATQFLKGQLSKDEIARLQNASQKIFFKPPDNEISSIANTLAYDTSSRKEWKKKLSSLTKGQCIVSGPVKDENGSLKQIPPITINVTSIRERIKLIEKNKSL